MIIQYLLALTVINGVVIRGGRVLLALYALNMGADPFTVGLIAATFSAFPTLLSWPAGKLADRFGTRWLLLVGALGAFLGMLIPWWTPGITTLFIAAGLNGLSFSIFNVSIQNLVGLLSNKQNRTNNFSNYSLMMAVSNLLGPLIAGFSIDHAGYGATCLYLGLMALAPSVMLAVWGGVLPGGSKQEGKGGGGLRELLANPGVRRTLATSSLLQSGQDLFQFYMPVYCHMIELSASVIGIVLAANAAAAFVVRLLLTRMIAWFNEEKVLIYAFTLSAVAFGFVPFFSNGVTLSLIAFIFGLGMGCGQPIITMLMFSHSAEGRSGEALGLRMTANYLTRVVGPIMFGSIGSAFGLAAVFWVNGLMLGTGGMLTYMGAGENDANQPAGSSNEKNVKQ